MPKILLVEDNEMNREMLSRRLVRKGYEVVIAVDGLQGVAMSVSESPELILMDMSLPVIDGWEATRRIKATQHTCTIPVIALTAHAMSDDRAKALAAGCDDFDTKPVDLARLLGKMDRLLTTSLSSVASVGKKASVVTVSPAVHLATLTLPAVKSSLPGFKTELEHFCMQAGVASHIQEDLQVVLDEVCANVFKHAYAPGLSGLLCLDLCIDDNRNPRSLVLTLTDQGSPFNPLAKAAPDTSLSWEERPIGGLGIHLVQTLTDEQSYSHTQADGNRLTLIKQLA